MTFPTAIVALIPQATHVIGTWRDELDPAKSEGMPAHVTVLWPFLPVSLITSDIIARLQGVAITHPAFDVRFDEIQWLGDTVVTLRPDPAKPFVALTRSVAEEFPECPPYEGRFDTIVPHLTVGHDGPHERLHAAADMVAAAPTIRSHVSALTLCQRRDEASSWRMVHTVPLGPPRRSR